QAFVAAIDSCAGELWFEPRLLGLDRVYERLKRLLIFAPAHLKLGVGSIDGVTQRRQQLRPRQRAGQALWGPVVRDVRRAGLAGEERPPVLGGELGPFARERKVTAIPVQPAVAVVVEVVNL